MPTRDIRTKLVLDGEREFNQAMKDLERQARILTSEMGKLEAQYGLVGDEQDYFTGKSDILTRQIELQEGKVRDLARAVADAAKKYGDSAKQTDGYRIKLNNAEKALYNMQKAQKDNEQAMRDYEEATRKFEDALDDAAKEGEDASRKMESAFAAFSAAASGDIGGLISSIDEMTNSMRESAENINDEALAIDGAMAGIVAATAAVVTAIVEIGTEMREQRRVVEREAAAMALALDLTEEDAKNLTDIAGRLYSEQVAESFDQAIADVTAVKGYMQDLDDTSLENITRQAAVFATAMNTDTESIIRAAAVMREQFAVSAEEAIALLGNAMQANPLRSDELLDSVYEYSVQLEQLGLSAEQMTSVVQYGLENTVFSIDMIVDALKEFGDKAQEDSETTRAAFQALGMDADLSMGRVAAGGKAASDTLVQVLERLSGMSDSLKQNEVAAALFGEQYKGIGTVATLSMLEAINTAGDLQGAVNTAAEGVSEYLSKTENEAERFYRETELKHGETLANIARKTDDYTQGITFDPVKEHLKELAEESLRQGYSIGENVGQGTVKGLKDQMQTMVRESESIFEKMFNGVKDFLGIHSPSRLYEQIGAYSGEGYIQGLEKQLAEAERNINMVLTPAFEAKTAPAARAGNVYNDYSQIVMKVDDVETFVEIKRRMATERVNKRMGYTGR